MAIEGLKRRATVPDWIVSPNANIVIEGGGAAEGGVKEMVEPGHSRKGGKYSDLEGGDATEGGVKGMVEPGRSRKEGKHSDLEGEDEGEDEGGETPTEREA
jgi:hypothetical protein